MNDPGAVFLAAGDRAAAEAGPCDTERAEGDARREREREREKERERDREKEKERDET